MRLPRVFRTAAFRLALAYAGLFALSTGTLFVLVYLAITDHVEDGLRELIEDEAEALVAQAEVDGLAALEATLRVWDETDRDRPASYALVTPSGRPVIGDLGQAAGREGWFNYVEPDDDEDDDGDPMLGFGVRLADGSLLVVAQETSLDDLEEAIVRAFLWAAGVSLALAVAGGVVTSVIFLRRLEKFNRTALHIVSGKLTERVPRQGTGDEFDRLADNLNAMLDRIQALMESMRRVSNDIAHDLRTPLSHLRQRLELARRDARDVEAYEAAVDRALVETDEILATFGALLRVAQIEAGTRVSGFTDVDLSGVFETIAETYTAVAEDNGQIILADIALPLTVRGDCELLTQMLANLVENAITHTPAGSTIRISLTQDTWRPVGVVADNGPGIPAQAREKVFRRFVRMDASRSTPGHGLGLSLVAAVAELHGIGVELDDAAPGLAVRLNFPTHSGSDLSAAGLRRRERGRELGNPA